VPTKPEPVGEALADATCRSQDTMLEVQQNLCHCLAGL
jgi:hypothetical protein